MSVSYSTSSRSPYYGSDQQDQAVISPSMSRANTRSTRYVSSPSSSPTPSTSSSSSSSSSLSYRSSASASASYYNQQYQYMQQHQQPHHHHHHQSSPQTHRHYDGGYSHPYHRPSSPGNHNASASEDAPSSEMTSGSVDGLFRRVEAQDEATRRETERALRNLDALFMIAMEQNRPQQQQEQQQQQPQQQPQQHVTSSSKKNSVDTAPMEVMG